MVIHSTGVDSVKEVAWGRVHYLVRRQVEGSGLVSFLSVKVSVPW